jgi:hypothetical protein
MHKYMELIPCLGTLKKWPPSDKCLQLEQIVKEESYCA